MPVPPGEARRLRVEVERPRRVARGEARIEREEREELGAGARAPDATGARPVRCAAERRCSAHVQRAERRVDGRERQLDGVDGRRRRTRGRPLEGRLDARAQVVEHRGPSDVGSGCTRLGGPLRGGTGSRQPRQTTAERHGSDGTSVQ